MKIRVREITEWSNGEEEEILQLHREIFGSETPLPKQEALDDGWWWFAYVGNTPVGFAGLVRGLTPGVGYLYRVGVLPAYRGHRLQRRFCRVREAKAKKLGLKVMVTDTNDPASANNLSASGYKMYEPERKWALKNSTYWRKELG